MKTCQQIITEAKAKISEVSAEDVRARLARGEDLVLIDVREQNEWVLGHAKPAQYIGRGVLESQIEARVPRESDVVLMCAGGNRSALAACSLQEMGYVKVSSMIGGYRAWLDCGGEVES